jgi:hypothetical protein
MHVFDLFEGHEERKNTPQIAANQDSDQRGVTKGVRGDIYNNTNIAGVRRAIDQAIASEPGAKSEIEAIVSYLDKQAQTNAEQEREIERLEREEELLRKKQDDLTKDLQDKETRFRDITAQLAAGKITQQQAAQMAQDVEAGKEPLAPAARPTQQAAPVAQDKPTQAQRPALRTIPGGAQQPVAQQPVAQQPVAQAGSRAFGQMAQQLTPGRVIKGKNQQAQQTAQPTQTTTTTPEPVAAVAANDAGNVRNLLRVAESITKQQPGQILSVPKSNTPEDIAQANLDNISLMAVAGKPVRLYFKDGQGPTLPYPQLKALFDYLKVLNPRDADTKSRVTNLLSNSRFFYEYMLNNIVGQTYQNSVPRGQPVPDEEPAADDPQGKLLEGDVVPMTDNQTTNQAYADALTFLKRVYANPNDPMTTTMRQDFAHKYQQRFQISQAPDRSYYLLDKQLSKKYKLPTPDFSLEEEPYDGKSDWSDGKGQWSSENNLISSGNNPMGFSESADDIKKRMSKLEALALAANRAGDDAKCKMYQQKIQSLKQKLSQSMNEFDASGYDRYSIYMDDYDLEEKFSDLDDAVDAIEAYKRDDPKSRYADYNVRDLNGKVVWRNDAWQDVSKPGKIQFLPRNDQGVDEATGDSKFDAMMGKISNDPWTRLNSDPNWEYEIEELVDRHIEPWLLAMEKSGMPITRDNETLNPGWRKRYEQVSTQLAQKYLASKKFNPRDPDLVGKIRAAIDNHTDQSRNVHGQLSAYTNDLPMQRYADAFDADGMTANMRDAMVGFIRTDDDDDDEPPTRPMPDNDPRRLDPGNMEESSKPGEYYVHTVYFKDGTKKRIRVTSDEVDVADYYTKRGKAVDRVDYDFQLHSDMSEAIGKKDLVGRLQKGLPKVTDPKNKNAGSVTWTGPGKDDYGYTGYQGHGMPTDKQERARIRANKKKSVAEGLLYSGDTWQDVLYRINVLNDIFGDQKDLAASFEPASQPEWGPFRDQILRSRTVLDTYAKVKQLANMNVPLTDVEIEMLADVAWDGGGGPVEPAGHWGERDYDWLEDLYAQQFAVVQHLLDQRAQGHGQNKTKSGQTVHEQGMAEAQTDYQKRRQRERDVDAGKPVSRQPKNPQTDYAKKRAKEKRDMELGEGTINYWTKLQNERNTKIASLVDELKESIEK